MSRVVATQHGMLRGALGAPAGWLLQCPGCDEWLPLSVDMLHGRVSVDHATDGCSGRYHETHDFASAVAEADPSSDRRRPCPQWSMDHCRCLSLFECERWASHDAANEEQL